MNLYPHQPAGRDFIMSRRRAYLGDVMGLGKTVQAIIAIPDYDDVLVVAPKRAMPNWEYEWGKWGNGQQVRVVSWASLHKVERDYRVVILDEAHRAKTKRAKRTKIALPLAAAAEKAILLSGTPMPNHPGELWTVFDALWPELLTPGVNTTEMQWFRRYCKYRETKYGPKVYGFQNATELTALLNQVMLRRKDDVVDLPPLRVTMDLLPCAPKTFEDMLRETPGAEKIREAYAAENLKDDPSTSRVRRLIGEFKAPYIAAKLHEELTDQLYQKIVVLYHHTSVGDILSRALHEHGMVRLDGRTRDGQAAVDQFTNDPETRVFLGQQTAAGEAINLQVASEIALCEPSWTPDANRQAIKRIHRIGQGAPCRARVFAVDKTLDLSVMETVALKSGIQKAIGL